MPGGALKLCCEVTSVRVDERGSIGGFRSAAAHVPAPPETWLPYNVDDGGGTFGHDSSHHLHAHA